MRRERRFDLLGRYVLAPRDDDLLQPPRNVEVTVAVHRAEIAGVQPTAAQRRVARLAGAMVAAHHRRSAADDLSGDAGRNDASFGVHDRQRDDRMRPADRSRPLERLTADRHRQPVRALRLAVCLDDRGAGEALLE